MYIANVTNTENEDIIIFLKKFDGKYIDKTYIKKK